MCIRDRLSLYHYDLSSEQIGFQESEWSDSLFYPIVDQQLKVIDKMGEFQWSIHERRVLSDDFGFGIEFGSSGIAIERFGQIQRKWSDKNFEYISGIDLDLDSKIEVLVIDSSGMLYSFNTELILMPGFPFEKEVVAPVLAKDIHGDEYPELIVRSADLQSLYVIDQKGSIIEDIAIGQNDNLVGIGDFKGKNSVYTSSTIFQFKDLSDISYLGNSWISFHGDINNTRRIAVSYTHLTLPTILLV